jgi:hypothetical protein
MRVVVVQIVQQSVSKVFDKPLVQPGVQAVCTLIELIQPLKEVSAILLNVYIPVGKEVFVPCWAQPRNLRRGLSV